MNKFGPVILYFNFSVVHFAGPFEETSCKLVFYVFVYCIEDGISLPKYV